MSGFRRNVHEICTLLAFYSVNIGSWFPSLLVKRSAHLEGCSNTVSSYCHIPGEVLLLQQSLLDGKLLQKQVFL
jgi:hypothetical protein